jgi:hypothetical protein
MTLIITRPEISNQPCYLMAVCPTGFENCAGCFCNTGSGCKWGAFFHGALFQPKEDLSIADVENTRSKLSNGREANLYLLPA